MIVWMIFLLTIRSMCSFVIGDTELGGWGAGGSEPSTSRRPFAFTDEETAEMHAEAGNNQSVTRKTYNTSYQIFIVRYI